MMGKIHWAILFWETVDGSVGLQLWIYKNEAGQDNLKKNKTETKTTVSLLLKNKQNPPLHSPQKAQIKLNHKVVSS